MADFNRLSKAAQAAFLNMQGRLEQIAQEHGDEDKTVDYAALAIYAEYKAIYDVTEGSLEAIKPFVLTRMLERGDEKFEDDAAAASVRIQEGRKTVFVNPKKLIERGVSADIVKYATEETQGEPFVVITVKRKKEEK